MYTKDSNFSKATKVIKWPFRILYAIVKLPAHISAIYQNKIELDDESKEIAKTSQSLEALNARLGDFSEQLKALDIHFNSFDNRLTNLDSRVQTISTARSPGVISTAEEGKRFADNHDLDGFYVGFEDRFRGTEEDIKGRVLVYPKIFKATGIDFDRHPVIDLGCGRGELLAAFHAQKIRAIGLDINYNMVKRARASGLEAMQGDAIEYLRTLKSASVGGITGMHLIEHIPFTELFALFQECFRVLQPGGLVAFETPNPENLMVGIYSFHMDPSHLKPLPPPLTGYALESAGFTSVEILRLHDARENRPSYEDPLLNDLSYRIYGPLDYTALAKKPTPLLHQPRPAKKSSR